MRPKDPDDELPFYPVKSRIGHQQTRKSWQNISRRLGEPGPRPEIISVRRLAAVTITCACLFVGGLLVFPRYHSVETAYGEIKKLYLPDSTLVVLNSNSRLRYPSNWRTSQRLVHLQGEAFFDVTSKSEGRARFTVYTQLLEVEVVGTVFNVDASLPGRTEVALNEGKVLLRTKRELSNMAREISMLPGDVVTVNGRSYKKAKDSAVGQRSAWITNDFYFDSTPLSEVAEMIERKYGYHVRFQHDSLPDLRLSGNLHAENFIQFEKALEITMKVDLTLRSDTLFIRAFPGPAAEKDPQIRK